jgi:hypothetical protein
MPRRLAEGAYGHLVTHALERELDALSAEFGEP